MRLRDLRLGERVRRWERATRPVDPEFTAALQRRWEELPEVVKTLGQVLGRHAPGCEGTHGVFPRCNLACTPCHHSRDANRVRVDGEHTAQQVAAQMGLLRRMRGPHAHAQLIGGEVSLLTPDDHARALAIMRAHGREPMSFTHSDIDYDYLEKLAVGPDGRRRFHRLSFAAHFDMLMFGRRGIERPPDERALNPYRQQFAEMFHRLRREHRIGFFLAHNMTVTARNLNQVADVIRNCHAMGYGMFSFQPAAFLGDRRRWHEHYRDLAADAVWAQIEAGAGTQLDYHVLETGTPAATAPPTAFASVSAGTRSSTRMTRAIWPPAMRSSATWAGWCSAVPHRPCSSPGWPAKPPGTRGWLGSRWAGGCACCAGSGRPECCGTGVRPVTFVMHRFMDAADVAPAWEMMQRGQIATDPRLRETQERLAACHYAMAHPEDGTLVPACVQHAVLDPMENAELRRLLPLTPVTRRPDPVS